jgi:hypothetical protein
VPGFSPKANCFVVAMKIIACLTIVCPKNEKWRRKNHHRKKRKEILKLTVIPPALLYSLFPIPLEEHLNPPRLIP